MCLDLTKSRGYWSGEDVTWTGENVPDHIWKWYKDMMLAEQYSLKQLLNEDAAHSNSSTVGQVLDLIDEIQAEQSSANKRGRFASVGIEFIKIAMAEIPLVGGSLGAIDGLYAMYEAGKNEEHTWKDIEEYPILRRIKMHPELMKVLDDMVLRKIDASYKEYLATLGRDTLVSEITDIDVFTHRWVMEETGETIDVAVISELRQYIRQILLEDRPAFMKALQASPNYNPDTMVYAPDKDSWMESEEAKEMARSDYKELMKHGRVIKKAFAKSADRAFLESLTLVHWTKKLGNIVEMIRNPRSKDELSCIAYLDFPKSRGAFGAYGLVVDGYVTLLANDMDSLQSGDSSLYTMADKNRTRDSGANKGVAHYDPNGIVLDKSDWNPDSFMGNEALVDNWVVTGVIVPDEDYDEMVEVFDDLYDETGKEYNLWKESMLS